MGAPAVIVTMNYQIGKFGPDQGRCVHTNVVYGSKGAEHRRCTNPVLESAKHGWLCYHDYSHLNPSKPQLTNGHHDHDLELINQIIASESRLIKSSQWVKSARGLMVEANRTLAPLNHSFVESVRFQWENVDMRPISEMRDH